MKEKKNHGSVKDVLDKLQSSARPDRLKGMARYGMAVDRRLGVSVPEMRKLAKEIGRDHELALDLWKTGVAEARILASMVADPARLTEHQMDEWVTEVDSWDVCDQLCMNLFEKSQFAWKKIVDWSDQKEEFVKRTAFSLIACLAWHDKKTSDGKFISLLPIIVQGAADERNFVKKSVNWALRSIGKRSLKLNEAAINAAKEIQRVDSKAARWIASDALRELQSDAARSKFRQ